MKRRSLVLALILAMGLSLPVLGAEKPSGKTYEQAVAELRGQEHYGEERVFETELCSVFHYSTVHEEFPFGAWARLAIVYKAGSPLGEGAVVLPPQPADGNRPDCGPDGVELSEDGGSFTYFYYSRPYGRMVYRVDLASGETDCSFVPFYQEFVASYGIVSWNMEALLETPDSIIALLWRDAAGAEPGTVRDYTLLLHSKTDMDHREMLLLPSTAAVSGEHPWYPTGRAPDEIFLNEDGSVLTYVYSFAEPLFSAGGEMLHDAGTYTYQVDTATGELAVNHAPLPSSGLGAEGTTFVDIAPGDWYAPYVEVCAEEGLMEGVGSGRFDPQGVMTRAQAITLAARLHHIQNGGDGKLPTAPENYGILKVRFDNGTTLEFDPTQYRFHPIPMSAVLGAEVEGKQLEAMEWLGLHDRAIAQVALGDGEAVPCIVYWNSYDEKRGHMRFGANYEGTEEEQEAFHALESKLLSPYRTPGWFRDTVYYLELEGLDGEFPLHRSSELQREAATRQEFICDLYGVAEGLLEPVNHISDFPDSTPALYSNQVYLKDVILAFYNAGILTGKDEAGTFDPQGTLTRAECAAMLARLMRPGLRLRFQLPPAPAGSGADGKGYSLTDMGVDLGEWVSDCGYTVREDCVALNRREGDSHSYLLLFADGRTLALGTDQPCSWGNGMVALRRGEHQYGVMDLESGEMILPFGVWGRPGNSDCRFLQDGEHFITGDPEEASAHDIVWDREGNRVWEGVSRWDWWSRFHDGLRPHRTSVNGLWGYVDVDANTVIEPQWMYADDFRDGYAAVGELPPSGYGQVGVIDREGREVISRKYHRLVNCGGGMFLYTMFTPDGYVEDRGMVRAWDGKEVSCRAANDQLDFHNGYSGFTYFTEDWKFHDRPVYVNTGMEPVSQEFDWAGPIGEDGTGFVGLDGRVFRIRFDAQG